MKTWIPEERTGWIKDNNGWWYRRPDGSYPANAWHTINHHWYLLIKTDMPVPAGIAGMVACATRKTVPAIGIT
ncbi:MAG: hypothetical protein ACLTW9_15790 [Enterocloster sp.]